MPEARWTGGAAPPDIVGFLGSRDLQNWLPIGTMNWSWFLARPHELTAAVASLSANFLGGEGRGEVALRFRERAGR